MADGAGWTRVVVEVAPSDGEVAADLLWGFDPAAVEEQAAGPSIRLLAGFADPAVARRAADALAHRGLGAADVVPVDDDGLDGWRPWARPVEAGPFTVTPTWLADAEAEAEADADADAEADAEAEADADGRRRVALLIDPGTTFGSGSHPTTRLVLARSARLVRPGHRVLDVGCGSGILAVGAALVGAGEVLGIDVDPGAPGATEANARANGVAVRVSATTAALADVAARPGREGRFDLVLANLLAPVVVELADHLAAVVDVGGHLVVSGLLADRWRASVDVVAAVAREGGPLEVVAVDEDDGWVAVTLAG